MRLVFGISNINIGEIKGGIVSSSVSSRKSSGFNNNIFLYTFINSESSVEIASSVVLESGESNTSVIVFAILERITRN